MTDSPWVVFEVPEGKRIWLGAPSLLALPNGKLLAAFDQMGPDVKGLNGKKGHDAKRNRWMQGLVMCSSDGGGTWQRVASYPYRRASLFRDGGDVYLLGEASGGLCLMRSPDGGASWSAPMDLTGDLDLWLSPGPVLAAGGGWIVPCLAPSGADMGLMCWRAPQGASLMNRKAWIPGPVSPPLADVLPGGPEAGFGVPWPGVTPVWRHPVAICISDPGHPWHAPEVCHVVASATSGREHWAVVMRVALPGLEVSVQAAENGCPWIWLPFPGGHAKFACIHDETTRRHWVVGSRGAPGLAAGKRAERDGSSNRLGVWASDNMTDWTGGGALISGGEGPPGVYADPSAAVSGNDLLVVARAGEAASRNMKETRRMVGVRLASFRSAAACF